MATEMKWDNQMHKPRFLVVACLVTLHQAVLPLAHSFADDEKQPGELTFIESFADEVATDTNTHSTSILSRDGRFVYVTRDYEDAVLVYTRNVATGKLTYQDCLRVRGPIYNMNGPQGMMLTLDNRFLYVAGFVDDTINVFSRDTKTGELLRVQTVEGGRSGVLGLRQVLRLLLSLDGKQLYALGNGDHTLVTFSRNPKTGMIELVDILQDDAAGLPVPGTDVVTTEQIEQATICDGLAYPFDMSMSPDGKFVYVASFGDSAISVFKRDQHSGALTQKQVIKAKIQNVIGLIFAMSVAVSPDGRNVYVGSKSDHLLVFERDPSHGTLTLSQVVEDDKNGVDGVRSPYCVAVNHRGDRVYVAGYDDDQGRRT